MSAEARFDDVLRLHSIIFVLALSVSKTVVAAALVAATPANPLIVLRQPLRDGVAILLVLLIIDEDITVLCEPASPIRRSLTWYVREVGALQVAEPVPAQLLPLALETLFLVESLRDGSLVLRELI